MSLRFLPLAFLIPLALSAQTHTLVVFHPGPHTIDELDPSTGKVLRSLQVEDQPHEAVMTPDGKTIFASLPGPGKVVIIDGATLTQTGAISSEYFQAPPHPQGRKGQISTSASPHALALNNAGTKLYVGLSYRESPGLVVYDLKAGKVLTKIALPVNGEFMAVQPGTDKLYIPNRQGLLVVDTKTDKLLKTISLPGSPTGADFAKNGDVWLSENGDGSITVLDSKKDEVIQVIPTGGKGAGRMAVSPDGKLAAATHDTTEDVMLIDTVKKEVVGTVNVGKGPSVPIFSPDSNRLYVITAGGPCSEGCPGNVVVVDAALKKVIGRYKVANDAFAVVLRTGAK